MLGMPSIVNVEPFEICKLSMLLLRVERFRTERGLLVIWGHYTL